MASNEYKTTFVNIKVPQLLWQECFTELPRDATELLWYFIDLAGSGVKFSFSFRESQRSYNVGITLPATSAEEKPECCTFWSDELIEALQQAYIVVKLYDAENKGFAHAKDAMAVYEKRLTAEFAAYRSAKSK